jgi:RNA polymerase sigma-70 factor (ECF subfamily)
MSTAAVAAPEDFSALVLAVARQRDQIAFGRLFEYFAPRIKRMLSSRGMEPRLAEELAQETMLMLWRKAGQFDPERANAATWIFTIARHQAIDHHRRDRSGFDAPESELENKIADVTGADEALSRAESEARLLAGLADLSQDQMQVIRLAYFHDKSHAQIAGELGLPLGTVKSRVRLALEKLRGLMGAMP